MMNEINQRHKGQKLDIEQILEQVPLLSGRLSKEELKKLAQGLHKREYKPGEYIMKEGEEGNTFYIIIEGKVEVSTERGGVVATLEEGDYAGEQALLKDAKRNASLKALEATICLVCYQNLFKSIFETNKLVKFAKRENDKRDAFLTVINEAKLNDDDVPTEKDNKTIQWLVDCVKENLLFTNLEEDKKIRIIQRMKLINVKKDEEIITQGDGGTKFYVVESGTFDVLIDNVKATSYQRGGCFGELALLYDSPRSATVVATSDSKVWEVDRKAFRYEVAEMAKRQVGDKLSFLVKIDLFKPLLKHELVHLSDALEEKEYDAGTVLFKEGEEGDYFYVIKEGVAQWSKSNGESGELTQYNFFGERALRKKEPRQATITAKTKLICYEMASSDFNQLLGPVLELIDEKIKTYQRSDAMKKEDEATLQRQRTLTETAQRRYTETQLQSCKLSDLKTIGILGKGGFGLVTLVIDPTTKKSYALKAIKKNQIIESELQKHIISEKKVMAMMSNKFLVNLHATYKDKYKVYFLLDVCLGGELFTILRQRRNFNEPTARFYAACVVEAFDYMHSINVIYRDLKPENLVLDSDGYLKVTDFGFAKVVPDKTFTLCGTPDYLCPEIVTGQGHGKGVDWWTLGILIYEMLASFPPFVAEDPIETYRKILRGRIRFPRYFSQESRELIRGLLHPKPTRRLGVLRGGANNIREHAWFRGFKWENLRQGKMIAPIINKVRDQTDLSNFAQIEIDDTEELIAIDPKDEFDHDF